MEIKPRILLASVLAYGLSSTSMVGASQRSLSQTRTTPRVQLAQNQVEDSVWLLNYIPPNYGTPPSTATQGGSRRGEQCSFSEPLVAMVYSESEIGRGRRLQYANEPTLESHPTFWFYAPLSQNNLKINLRVQRRADGEVLHEEALEFSVEQTGSIIGFPLPDSATGFEVGEVYRWILQIDCDEDTPPIRVSALMERVEADGASTSGEVNTDTPRERISQLVDQQLLHDALNELALLYIESPDDYQVTLDSLLESANMSPLVPVSRENFLLLQGVDAVF